MPVGFKNSTNGDCKVALDAVKSASHKHCFNGITRDGIAALVTTNGNNDCHIILRGSNNGPNYYTENLDSVHELYKKNNDIPKIMIDCSHGNSEKNYKNQSVVFKYIIQNYLDKKSIFGYMLESNINEGNQKLENSQNLKYGVSITDSCISFDETIILINEFYNAL